MKKKATDEILLRIAMLAETCADKLKELDLPCIDGIYALKDFEISLTSKHPGGAITGRPMFDFWRKGKRNELWTRFDGELNSFILHKESEEKRVVFEDYIGLRIEEFIKAYPVYPQFQLSWTGVGAKRKAQHAAFSYDLFLSDPHDLKILLGIEIMHNGSDRHFQHYIVAVRAVSEFRSAIFSVFGAELFFVSEFVQRSQIGNSFKIG